MDRRQFLTTTAGIALGGFGGWAEANDYIVANSSEAMEALQLQPNLAGGHLRVIQGAKDVHLTRLETALLKRHGHQLAAAIDRLLHDECRDQGRHQQECTAHAGHFRSRQRPTVTAVCPHLPTIRGTPGTIAASPWLTERQHCHRGISPGIRRTWLAAATPAPPESAAIPAIPC